MLISCNLCKEFDGCYIKAFFFEKASLTSDCSIPSVVKWLNGHSDKISSSLSKEAQCEDESMLFI